MKKIYTTFLAMFFACLTYAQTPLTTAVDITGTDINGTSQSLFSYLNAGKYVCIMFTMYG